MSLVPDATRPGRWVNPQWRDGQPGLFAVVIGVSRYQHLKGGDAPVPETYDLGQLAVSALTAFNMFQWLSAKYFVRQCPVARCWLLLSPTDAEQANAPALANHVWKPTFAACEAAIGEWYGNLKNLPPATAAQSRAMFFFSGHGLEIHQNKQVLLPSDYLAPPAQNWDRALSTENLQFGLASLAVPLQFFFLDACRNDHQKLRSKNVRGTRILPEDESAQVNSALVAPLLYATASGHQAWQRPTPPDLSLFGTALLEGLGGQPDIELRWRDEECSVNLYPLQGYVKRRIVRLLAQAGAQVTQPVKLGGSGIDDEALTYFARHPVHDVPPAAVLPPGWTAPPVLTPAERSMGAQRSLEAAFTDRRPVPEGLLRSTWARDFRVGHPMFGSEDVTAIWSDHLTLIGLAARQPRDADAVVVHRVDQQGAQEGRSFRVELSIGDQDEVGHWLEFRDEAGGMHGCVLPTDHAADGLPPQPRYVVEFDMAYGPHGSWLARLEASVSLNSPHFSLSQAAHLWQRFRTGELGHTVEEYEGKVLENMVRHKRDSSLAATTAAIILLRANRIDLLHDWLRNLADWFPHGADAPVLWAEQLLRGPASRGQRGSNDPPWKAADGESARSAATASLLRLLERGLPLTSEGLSYAATLADRLGGSRSPFELLQTRLEVALRYFRPGGLFCCFSGFDAGTDPAFLLGLPTRDVPQPPAPGEPLRPPHELRPAGTIEKREDYIVVGGVRVPRQPGH